MQHRALRRLAVVVASLTGIGVLTAVPSRAAHRAAADAPVVACTGDPTTVQRLDVTIAGTPTWGLYALPAGRPRGLVVFDHGYSHTPESWRHHLADTAQHDGVIAVAMDYRGSIDIPPAPGQTLPSARGWQVAEGAEDSIFVARLFDRACPGLRTIVVYGVSMGGNTSGLVAAAHATRVRGNRPLFDWWIDVEGATNVSETYQEARAVAKSGNTFAKNAQADIEREMGGTFEEKPSTYLERTVVTRADDIRASGIRGVVMVHGVGDGLVPYNQTREMAARLREVGIPTDLFTVLTRGASSEPGTTLDGTAFGSIPGYQSPFAGHASEASSTQLVGNTGFARLDALFNQGDAPRCHREFLVDGTTGTTTPVPGTAC